METDPRGQLGGLEATDDIRKRHAQASQTYKCPTCAKTNAEIMQESEEAAKASETAAEVEVPSELKMGWKDEMGKAAENSGAPVPTTSQAASDHENAELAEGFVQTAAPAQNVEAASAAPPAAGPPPATTQLGAPQAREGRHVPQPTPTVPLPAAVSQPAQLQIAADDGIPVWVDRAIVIIVVILIAMILKALLED